MADEIDDVLREIKRRYLTPGGPDLGDMVRELEGLNKTLKELNTTIEAKFGPGSISENETIVLEIRELIDAIQGKYNTNDLLREIERHLDHMEERLKQIEDNTGKGFIGEILR